MSSKKASFESRDPSYVPTNTKSSEDKNAPVAWTTGDEPAAEAGMIAPQETREADKDEPDKASFYTRDINKAAENVMYKGKERRKTNRRSTHERRTDVRFELDSNDRRQNTGRRKTDFTPKYW